MQLFPLLRPALLALSITLGPQLLADSNAVSPVDEPKQIGAEAATEITSPDPKLDSLLSGITEHEQMIGQLEPLVADSDNSSGRQNMLQRRLAKLRVGLLEKSLNYVKQQLSRSPVADSYRQHSRTLLDSHYQLILKTLDELKQQLVFPATELAAADEAAAYYRFFKQIEQLDHLYALSIRSIDYSRQLEVTVDRQQAQLKLALSERAANNSMLLDLALEGVADLKAGVAVMPDDSELAAKLKVKEDQVQALAVALKRAIDMMTSQGLNSNFYREQVIATTGQISTEVLHSSVLATLLLQWGENTLQSIIEQGPNVLLKLSMFIAILLIARKLSKVAEKIVAKALQRSNAHLTKLLKHMIATSAGNLIMLLGILIALSQVGITLGPLLAGLGVAGFVIGFAMQDTLSNFASGMMVLFYRPFDVGDIVEIGGAFGEVSNMSLVNTTIHTLDNQTLIVPNNKVWGDVIKNITSQRTRRVDLVFGIAYGADIPQAEQVMQKLMDDDERVLKHPKPMIKVHELADSSVNFVFRPWVKTDDYWDVYWDMTRAVKLAFDQAGIGIPFPQRDIHLNTTAPLTVRVEHQDTSE